MIWLTNRHLDTSKDSKQRRRRICQRVEKDTALTHNNKGNDKLFFISIHSMISCILCYWYRITDVSNLKDNGKSSQVYFPKQYCPGAAGGWVVDGLCSSCWRSIRNKLKTLNDAIWKHCRKGPTWKINEMNITPR